MKAAISIYVILFINLNNLFSQVLIQPQNIQICFGGSGALIVNGPITATYNWQDSTSIGWNNISSSSIFSNPNNDTLLISSPPLSLNATRFRCILDSNGTGLRLDTTNSVTVTVYNPLAKPVINGNQNICFNTQADTLRRIQGATGANGSFTYQWQDSFNGSIWSNISGQNGNNLLTGIITNSQFYRLRATSNFGCGSVSSDSVFVNVYPIIQKPVISTSQNICFNTQADTLRRTQAATGANGSFTYQWQDSLIGSSWINITGHVGDKFVTGIISNSKFYRLRAISTFGCGSVSSDSVFVNVYPIIQKPVISTSQNICFNTQADTLRRTQAATGGNNTFSYQWQSSLNGTIWSDESNQSAKLLTGNLLSSKYFRMQAISSSNCGSVFSDSIFIKVYSPFVKASIGNSSSICWNTKPDTLKITTSPSGGSLNYIYQWLISIDSINWVIMPGELDRILLSSNLNNTTFFKLISSSTGNCGSDSSNTVKINVFPKIVKPEIGSSQNICFNSIPDTISLTKVATGATGTFNYKWQYSDNGSFWDSLMGIYNPKLSIGSLIASKYYRVLANSSFGCGSIVSDSVLINVYPQLAAGTINGLQSICFNSIPSVLSFINVPSGGGDSFSYKWQISTDSIAFNNINSATNNTYQEGSLTTSRFYRAEVKSTFGCGIKNTNTIKVNVFNPFVKALIGKSSTICWGEAPPSLKIDSMPKGGNLFYNYTWLSSNDNLKWDVIIGENSTRFSPNILTSTKYYKLISASGQNCGSDSSNSVKILVNPLPDTVSIIGNEIVCRNQKDLKYNLSKDSILYSYFWNIKNGDVLSGINKSTVYIDWRNVDGIDTINLTQTNKITACKNVMKLPITISENKAPDKTNIIRKPNSDILICDDETPQLIYQWGYTIKSTNQSYDIINANLRYVALPNNFDTTKYIYWVKTSLLYDSSESCMTQSYFYYNPIPLKINEQSLNRDDIVLFPNPSNGLVFINGLREHVDLIELFNCEGQKVNFEFNHIYNNLFINDINANGLYFIVIKIKDSIITKKINIIR